MSPLFTALAQSNSGDSGGFVIGGAIFIVVLVVGVAAFAFWIWMLVDLLQSSRPTNEKILWAVVMLFAGIVGSIIYLIVARGSATSKPA